MARKKTEKKELTIEEKLELIRQNNKINKRLSSYEKHNDMPLEEEYADYYEALEKEYCE